MDADYISRSGHWGALQSYHGSGSGIKAQSATMSILQALPSAAFLLVLWAGALARADEVEGSGGGCDCEELTEQIAKIETSVSEKLAAGEKENRRQSHEISRLISQAQHNHQSDGKLAERVNKLDVEMKRVQRQGRRLESMLAKMTRRSRGRVRREHSADTAARHTRSANRSSKSSSNYRRQSWRTNEEESDESYSTDSSHHRGQLVQSGIGDVQQTED